MVESVCSDLGHRKGWKNVETSVKFRDGFIFKQNLEE